MDSNFCILNLYFDLTFIFKSELFDNILTFKIIVKADWLHDDHMRLMLFFLFWVEKLPVISDFSRPKLTEFYRIWPYFQLKNFQPFFWSIRKVNDSHIVFSMLDYSSQAVSMKSSKLRALKWNSLNCFNMLVRHFYPF